LAIPAYYQLAELAPKLSEAQQGTALSLIAYMPNANESSWIHDDLSRSFRFRMADGVPIKIIVSLKYKLCYQPHHTRGCEHAVPGSAGKTAQQENLHELLRQKPAESHQLPEVRVQGPQAEIKGEQERIIIPETPTLPQKPFYILFVICD
jgi:hypothetical protein